jgi:MFS family permease
MQSATDISNPAPLTWWQRSARALRHQQYRRYFLAQVPLVIGSWIHSIALGWLMWELSASPWLLGILAVCDLGPTFLLGPITGTVIDRTNPRRVLLVTQMMFVVLVTLLAALTLSGAVTIPIMIVLTLALGITAAFDSPARQALVGELVPADDLRNAIALNSMLFNVARLIGPAVGGTIVALFGEGWCFVIKALAYLPALYVIFSLRLQVRETVMRESFVAQMRAGFAFVRGHEEAGRILLLVGTCSFISVPYFSFLPALAADMLGADASVAGMLMSITGIGAVTAAITLTVLDDLNLMRFWPVWSSVLLGLAQIGIGLSGALWLTALLALPMGFAILSQNLSSNTLLQHFAPPGFRGRIMAMYSMMMLGTVPLGSLVAGAIGDRWGMPITFVGGGVLCVLVALLLAIRPKPTPSGSGHLPPVPPIHPVEHEVPLP